MMTTATNTSVNKTSIAPIIAGTMSIYRWAVYLSFAFIGAGLVLAAFTDHEIETKLGTPIDMLRHALELDPTGFFGIGIGVMILAPIAMLGSAAVTFFRNGDRRYGTFTSVVAMVLSLSILIAFLKG